MNENHKRRLAVGFRHIDDLVREAAQALSGTEADSPFARLVSDATPVQQRVIEDYGRRVRMLMLAALDRHGVPRESPRISALRSASTTLLAAEIAIEELEPERMRGSGTMSVDAARALSETCTELRSVLGRMRLALAAGTSADLEARIRRTPAVGEVGELLASLARVISSRGLVALRPTMERLADEVESASYEIAVFGRVSSGKSSLLNHLIGRRILPVGVTPVTSVPTRIVYGAEERAIVHRASERPIVIPLAQLPGFATEQGNRSNRRHVTEIRVEVPEERLSGGVTLVDTPGLGSLATSGAAESLAYLPRADLGIVLSDASAALSPEDVAVVDALVRAEARAMVVLSKADLLTREERQRVRGYVAAELRQQVGLELPVHAVSVRGAGSALADAWFQAEIRPLFEAQRELRRESLARKASALRATVLGTLRERIAGEASDAVPPSRSGEVEQALRRAAARVERARRQCLDVTDGLLASSAVVIESASGVLATTGLAAPAVAPAILADAARRHVGAVAERLVALLTETREALAAALRLASEVLAHEAPPSDLPPPHDLPVFDAAAFPANLALRPPLLGFLGSGVRRRSFAAQLRPQVAEALDDALGFQRRRLQEWCRATLDDLGLSFEAAAGRFRARLEESARHQRLAPQERAAIRRDIELLDSGREQGAA